MFLYLAFQAMHSPCQAPQEYINPFTSTIPDQHRRTVAGMVAALDEGVGNVTRALRSSRMLKHTLIVFTTDNGGQPSTHYTTARFRDFAMAPTRTI